MATMIPFDQLAPVLRAIPSLPRPVLARLAQRLIDRLDDLDGDPDLEDDDPAGGSADDVGEVEEWREDGIVFDRPIYGEDQSLGPINTEEAYRKFKKAQFAQLANPRKENPRA